MDYKLKRVMNNQKLIERLRRKYEEEEKLI